MTVLTCARPSLVCTSSARLCESPTESPTLSDCSNSSSLESF
eukprot:CAMPEP_0174943206 /NCGR_PEP_ID=MMETSP1355-20121228/76039_1 /TAXON_ID=464990 /ORGANISM="Hemiselmis tepida, Strain CCMP443" /LENGTH=41 /DNA_ID= /DNA_START= /DNA_END= /DNA_ORIENTATION=